MKKSFYMFSMIFITAILFIFVSCSNNNIKQDENIETTQTAAETVFDNGLPDNDLEGYEINFIGKGQSFGNFEVYDVYVEAETGDLLNDALFARNRKLENQYNFTIKFNPVEGAAFGNTFRPSDELSRNILAGDHTYDVIYDGLTSLTPLAQNNMFYNLYNFPVINFNRDWWDISFNNEISIGKKLFFTYGSHMLGPYDGLYCVLFNKQLIEDYNLGDMYETVNAGKWTLSTFASLIKDIAVDLNGDGLIGYEDLIPYNTESYNAFTFYIGAGGKIAEKGEDDIPYMTIGTDQSINIIEKVMDVMQNEHIVIAEKYLTKNDYASYVNYYVNGFINNQFFFREGALMEIDDLRSMDTDFGILPSPKLNEEQDRYYHIFSVWNAAMMSIPVNVKNADTIGFILEALAAESYNSVISEYIERHLVTKYTRDDSSESIIYLILDSMTIDLGGVFNWGGVMDQMLLSPSMNGKRTFASTYTSIESSANKALEKTLEGFSITIK